VPKNKLTHLLQICCSSVKPIESVAIIVGLEKRLKRNKHNNDDTL